MTVKRLILICIVCFAICSCSNQKYNPNNEATLIESTALNEEKSDYFTKSTAAENQNTSQSTSGSENTALNKWEPNVFDLGKRTLEDFSPPWTEELTEKAWQMSYLADNFTSYMDRCFADLDNDGAPELILTANNVFFCMAAYKINDGEIQYLDTVNFGGDIGRSILTLPPTDSEILNPCNDKSNMWDSNAENTGKRNFKIFSDEKGDCFFTGYGTFDSDNRCFAIKIGIEDGKLVWRKAYQWGYRWAYDLNADSGRWFLYYSSYDQSGEEQSVNKQYIDDFLAQLSRSDERRSADDTKIIEGLDGGAVNIDSGYIDSMSESMTFENFTYYRNATGLSFNDSSYLERENIWHKLNVGDTFGTLTVSSAYSEYITNGKEYENAANLSETDANWYERGAKLDGRVTLEGIISANFNEEAYWSNVLFFQADPKSLKEQEFPLLKSISFSWARDVYPYGTDNDMVEDTEVFCLGSAEQYNNLISFKNFADSDGTLKIYVRVELSDISLKYHIGTGSTPCGENTAYLCSVSLI